MSDQRLMYDSPKKLMADYFNWRVDTFPMEASKTGVHKNDHHLRDNSLLGFKNIEIGCNFYKLQAEQMLKEGLAMTDVEKHFLQTMEKNAAICSKGMKLQAYLMAGPSFIQGGVQNDLPESFGKAENFKLECLQDYHVIIQRLKCVPKYVSNVIEVLKEGVRKNMTLSIHTITRSNAQFDKLLSEQPEETLFFKIFLDMKETLPNEKNVYEELIAQALNIIRNEIQPAFQDFRDYVFNEYVHHTRSSIAITSLTDGKAYYDECLRFHTTTNLTADEVHLIGLEEIKGLRQGVMEVAKSVGKENSTFSEFMKKVRDDPTQGFESAEDLIHYIEEILHNKINPKMKLVLPDKYINEEKLHVDVKHTESVSMGSYEPKPFFGTNSKGNATFFINLSKLGNFKKFELLSLTLHETNPGHHLHLSVFMESSGFPDFLKARVGPTYAELPSSFPYYTAMLEGWGLYSEFLGHELGMYEDPYDLLGYYSWNLLRAARLVVDTGIHTKGWTRQQAIAYLLDNTALSNDIAEREIDRYITYPGHATAYKIGDRMIREQRTKQEALLGDRFDLRVFHERIMKCFGLLSDLEESMAKMRTLDKKESSLLFC